MIFAYNAKLLTPLLIRLWLAQLIFADTFSHESTFVKSREREPMEALYYPYSRLLSEEDLKRSLLIFEKLYFVDPLSNDISRDTGQYVLRSRHFYARSSSTPPYHPLYRRLATTRNSGDSLTRHGLEKIPDWYDVAPTYLTLSKQGVVELVNSAETYELHSDLSAYSTLCDIALRIGTIEDQFDNFSELKTCYWRVHKSRVPPQIFEYNLDFISDVCRQTDCALPKDRFEETAEYIEYMISGLRYEYYDDDEAIKLPLNVAFVLITNQALQICAKKGIHPVTDDRLAHDAMIAKVDRYAKLHSGPMRDRTKVVDMLKTEQLAFSVATRYLTDDVLKELSFDDIFSLRARNKQIFSQFQHSLQEFAAEIETAPWDDGFSNRLEELIRSKITPKVEQLDSDIKSATVDILGTMASKSISELSRGLAGALPTMTTASIIGLSLAEVALLGAATFFGAAGQAIPSIGEALTRKRRAKQHGLSFLLNFER